MIVLFGHSSVPRTVDGSFCMHDSYLNFANSPMGAKLAGALGLPKPLVLERYQPGQAVIEGAVLLGGNAHSTLLPTLAQVFKSMNAQTLAHRQLPQWLAMANAAGLMSGRWGVEDQPGEKVKALVFDATGLIDSSQSTALYDFFTMPHARYCPAGG